jgi:hypothetical protein
MQSEGWHEGMLYDDEGEYALARIDYSLSRSVEIDGFVRLAGSFVLREELCPLHTGAAQLVSDEGERWLVWVLRLSRPKGDGDLEVVEPVTWMPAGQWCR